MSVVWGQNMSQAGGNAVICPSFMLTNPTITNYKPTDFKTDLQILSEPLLHILLILYCWSSSPGGGPVFKYFVC